MEINNKKLVEYWKETADNDWRTAELLWKSKRYDACLFYCHLVLERLLKGLVVLKIKKHAPFTHDLVELLRKSGIKTDEGLIERLAIFTGFNLRCRYSKDKTAFYKIANRKFTEPYFKDAKKINQMAKGAISIKKIEQLARDVAVVAKKDGMPISRVFVFGSYAKGTAIKEKSDLDLCFVSSQFGDAIRAEAYLRSKIFFSKIRLDIPVDVVAYQEREFEQEGSPLLEEIKTTGKEIALY